MTAKDVNLSWKLAWKLHQAGHALPSPMTREWIDDAEARGMIPKAALERGRHYVGACRNGTIAMWDGDRFRYIRLRPGGRLSIESLPHPEDDDGFDLFVPFAAVFDDTSTKWGPK